MLWLLFFTFFTRAVLGADYTVNGTTVYLNGTINSYDRILVTNGGRIIVTAYNGTGTTGTLNLTADYVYVDSTSSITANTAGYRGVLNANGEGTGGGQGGSSIRDGAGGGGHGGVGGRGTIDGGALSGGTGGVAYGNATSTTINMGSAGGAAGSADGDSGGYGGNGGGAITIRARQIVIAGTVQAEGAAGLVYNNDAAGGGAGGGILLWSDVLTCTGTLYARGGSGGNTDDDGGGGAGGVIKQIYDTGGSACNVVATGGTGPDNATDGGAGLTNAFRADWDGDGYTSAQGDCNTANAAISPAATEVCDGIDNNCNGIIDGADAPSAPLWYQDADADGYGNVAVTTRNCSQPSGHVGDATDCNDSAASAHPGATELCNGIDDDCDGLVDENVQSTWYADADGDGYGDAAITTEACTAPTGFVSTDTDCNDADAWVNPGANEICNAIDDDCDGVVDEDSAVDAPTWYQDSDADGYGSASSSLTSCNQPAGYVSQAGDCNDSDGMVNPDGIEVCNGIDDNCDGTVDESSAVDAPVWYADQDGDGYGNVARTVRACAQPVGHVSDATDCDDGTAMANPGHDELCDGIDNDCDGFVDENTATDAGTWYRDRDLDGYGDPTFSQVDCTQPAGFVSDATDCDDNAGQVNPGATELCNGIDDDCDGQIDENSASNTQNWYLDADVDGYGDASVLTIACDQPLGYVSDPTDCNDQDATIHPNATELCDGIDNNCDGMTDEPSSADAPSWYADLDGDGFGDAASLVIACHQPNGYVTDSTDCDDGSAAVNTLATELCDGIDNDCDGIVDESDAADASTWYLDLDRDGYGDPNAVIQGCTAPEDAVSDSTDCDDTLNAVNPGATEVCDGIDDDCDGLVDEGAIDDALWYVDLDGDGYGDASTSVRSCQQPEGYVLDATDCNDQDIAVSPMAAELCNGIDDDCDGTVDENESVDAQIWYADLDGDGYGDPNQTMSSCTAPVGYTLVNTDCNDNDATVNPSATEICDGLDNDCDGQIDENDAMGAATWYADADADGFGDAATRIAACTEPEGYVADNTDCDDTQGLVNPAATETWYDGIDQDCNGGSDYDADLDGYDSSDWGGVDCDDTDANIHPDAKEIWYDGIDGNCDGLSDYDYDGDGFDSASYGGDDCDDNNAIVYPGAPDDPYDGIINDCNNVSEYDADQDGYTSSAFGGDDCDDANSSVHPDSKELWYDGIDQDCDGNDMDKDGDGWILGEDCDDEDAKVFPGAPGWTKDCVRIDTGDTGIIDTGDTGIIDTGETGIIDTDETDTDETDTEETDTSDTDLVPETGINDTSIPGWQLKGGGGCSCAMNPQRAGLAAGWLLMGLVAIAGARRRN